MNNSKKIGILTLGISLALGSIGPMALAADTVQTGDQSSDLAEAVGDAWITTKVKAELATASNVPSLDISVTTVDGVVTLIGVLPSHLTVERAIALTRGVDGVLDVDASGLKVGNAADVGNEAADGGHSSSIGQTVDDAWITTKVKADLATTSGVSATDITVKTVDGAVSLVGTVPDNIAKQKAIAVARAIKGVTRVDVSALVVAE